MYHTIKTGYPQLFQCQMLVLQQLWINRKHLFVQQVLVKIDNQQLYSDCPLHVQYLK